MYCEGGGRAESANPCKTWDQTGLSYLRPAIQLSHRTLAVQTERSTQWSLTDWYFQT